MGKSTIVSAFAEREYKSHIIIDFSKVSRDIINLFDNLMNMDYIFLRLQAIYHVVLETRKSVIVFDEVQLCPKARQAIKHFSSEHSDNKCFSLCCTRFPREFLWKPTRFPREFLWKPTRFPREFLRKSTRFPREFLRKQR